MWNWRDHQEVRSDFGPECVLSPGHLQQRFHHRVPGDLGELSSDACAREHRSEVLGRQFQSWESGTSARRT